MAPLEQPWKEYLAQKDFIEQKEGKDQDPELKKEEVANDGMCPGSEECGFEKHALGSTTACAFRSHMACEVVMQGSTGTSG
ncbi:hypothetical protein N7467_009484 [Penicillium canescens]|nr:hypothetical protein N7467_009484 [Penicillium canescens]